MAELVLTVDVDAPPATVFAAATDWAGQGEWMLGTRVRPTHRGGVGVGGRVTAFTGAGRLGFLDPMEITVWEPPRRCLVRHLGGVVRGAGAFEVEELPDGRSRFVWSEWLELPLGVLGQLGWLLVRPAAVAGVRRSLRRFAAWAPTRVTAGDRPGDHRAG
ncbi:MAG TPA: SRPBCC family protein [Frankiaceae bacterium]|nr:SRPBCC family protein [Frankiaceae bacterium]